MPVRFISSVTIVAAALVVSAAAQQTTFGSAVTLTEAIPFARVQERPSALEGQTIRVDGVVSSVGAKTACWLGMVGGGGSDYALPIFVRVEPCTVMFPKNAVTRKVSVQGVMTPLRLDPDPAVKDAAAEFGEAESGGALPLWELKATGVVLQ